MSVRKKRKSETSPSQDTPATAAASVVQIRMYNTGFGDCFLLKFTAAGREQKILIDCGKHTLSKCGPKLATVVQQVLADIDEPDGPRIDVLVVTHRHQDHVSGFEHPGWENVRVGEVWMPWTEDPNDPEARRICDRQCRRALQLHTEIIPRLGLAAVQRNYLLGYAGNNLKNEKAMRLLHEGFPGSPVRRFFPEKEASDVPIKTNQLSGVEVFALGPSRDPEVIRDMEPPDNESYFQAVSGGVSSATLNQAPFPPRWVMSRDQYVEWFKTRDKHADPLADFPAETAQHLRQIVDNPETELAATLEASVNGTSLVLLFKIGRAVLLFPGDAQWGTWNALLSNERWHPLLRSVTFYKVGHHGSHNATPRRFVEELLPATAWAMVPTDDVKKWPLIPKAELLEKLTSKGIQFVRSDRAGPNDPKCFRRTLSGKNTLCVDMDLPC